MQLISSNLIRTRNLPTVIICKAAWEGILLFIGFSGILPSGKTGGLAFISLFIRLESHCAVLVLQVSAHQECWGNLCDCRSLSSGKLLSLVLCCTEGIHLWEVLLLHVIDATIRQVRDLVVLVYYPKVVNISIVILSDDLISLENCSYEIRPGKMTSVGMPVGL